MKTIKTIGITIPTRFTNFLAAAALSCLVDGMVMGALPLLAIRTTNEPFLVALLSSLGMLPWLLMSVPAGLLLDRADRFYVTDGANVLRCLLFAGVALAAATAPISYPLLVVMAVSFGVLEVAVDTGHRTMIPEVAEGTDLHKANSRYMTVEILCSKFFGVPCGVWLVGRSPVALATVVAGGYLASALIKTLLVRTRGSVSVRPVPTKGRSWRRDVAAGFRIVYGHPVLRALTLTTGAINFIMGATGAIYILLIVDVLNQDEAALGAAKVAFSLGGMSIGLYAERIQRRLGDGRALVTAAACLALGTGLPLLCRNFGGLVIGAFLSGLAPLLWNVVVVTYRQQIVTRAQLGRTQAAGQVLTMGLVPIGAAIGGLAAETLGVTATFQVAALVLGAWVRCATATVASIHPCCDEITIH